MFKLIFKKFSKEAERDLINFKKFNALFKLPHRNVVSVTGEDACNFLQSMITNDMRLLDDEHVSLNSLFLSPKGKILFESMIVKSKL